VGSVDSPRVLVACNFASVGFFGNNESSSLKATKTNHIISGTICTITGIHSKIVRLTSHEWLSIYGWLMANSWAVSFVREWPSFVDITLYQLCYWKVTHIYGLTPEEIEDLLTNPDSNSFSPSSWSGDHQGIFDRWECSNLSSKRSSVTFLFWNPSSISS
jgi:hypothetical protein